MLPFICYYKGVLQMVDKATKSQLKLKYKDSQIYVVPASEFADISNGFTRLKDVKDSWITCLDNKGRYIFRYDAEYEPSLQQPIPYALVKHRTENKYYVAKRIKGEERLLNQLILGFGGHVDLEDGIDHILANALIRELDEELIIDPTKNPGATIKFLGNIREINSPTNDHTGFVFLVLGTDVSINEDDNLVGQWMTVQELENNYYKFEDWARHIIDYLVIHNYQF